MTSCSDDTKEIKEDKTEQKDVKKKKENSKKKDDKLKNQKKEEIKEIENSNNEDSNDISKVEENKHKPSSNKTEENNAKPESTSKPDNEKPNPESKPKPKPDNNQKPSAHIHNWVAKTIHHQEKGHMEKYEVQPGWDEKEVVARDICNQCGADITDIDIAAHGKAHALAGEGGGHHTEWRETGKIIHHEAVYDEEWVVDQEPWDETYYVCSGCGKRK